MRKAGIVVRSENYSQEFSRDFHNRSRGFIARTFGNVTPPWKASTLYDEKLNETAVFIAVGRQNFYDAARLEALWYQILEICAKNDVTCLVTEDVPAAPFALSWPVFDGTAAALFWLIGKGIADGSLNRYSDIGVFTGWETSRETLLYLCEEFNYIKFYSADPAAARSHANAVYEHNGTAAEVATSLLAMSRCDASIILDRAHVQTAGHLKCPFVADPWAAVRSPGLAVRAYTDRLGEITMGAAYFETLYYNRFQMMPAADVRKFEAAVRYQYSVQ